MSRPGRLKGEYRSAGRKGTPMSARDWLGACVALGGWLVAFASPLASAAGDPALGRPLVEKDCNGCHVRQFGSVERIYLRPDRRVHTPAQLKAQVTYCNTQLGTSYFPEEEEHIAAWLNQQYYRFNP
jgi:hypothetical protein